MTTTILPDRTEPTVDAVAVQRPLLGELLVQSGKLSARDLERALSAQQEMGGLLGRVLVRLGLVSEIDVIQALSRQLDIPLIAANDFPSMMPEVEGLLPEFLHANSVYPLSVEDGRLHVAMAVPQDAFVVKALHLATGLAVVPRLALESDIEKALAEPVEQADEEGGDDGFGDGSDGGDFVEHLKDLASEAPVIRLVNAIIGRVIDLRASDIHLEPFDDGLHVRYRVDGVIQLGELVPPRLSAAVSSRVKLLAHLDIAERRLPQDGRIKTRVKGRELDLRVSTVPTVHGESVVMRVLDRASVRLQLETMGFEKDTLERFNMLLAKPHGILLVTGPTGSGKTTTLYAALSKIDAESNKIITVEDPVEYQLEGINQIQVHPQINLTFANALRSILRQDPDIIMIGEMRDGETAQIAVQSALTGHLVLSTLHTNTAAGAVIRMKDMGVEGYLITSSVNGVLAQRLVRTLCSHCKEPYEPGDEVRRTTGLHRFSTSGQAIYRAVGCEHCRGSGYRGRTGIHELFVLDEPMRRAIIDGKDANTLNALAAQGGMLNLYEDGLRKVAAGVTTLDELSRVTQDQGDA
ncbi:type II secretion system ATPase GspE [Paracidovorax avenae]|uniref:type II secretion system ATPase GspE n=1 Tax=Paracidovorax avenae TaxID=80867 RepID=UPI000D20F2A7|nr:type II secretion system ATPase GspE [Paracidovorax avenae]AVS96728.1 type II secretion system protein GspE [Paracidovorax avenae]AVT03835.1 type II secretion system protein GspE [Paracidovorax avenae]AVT10751.1 type II secretion system protein GspE [Paracidovorax avenae]